MTEWGSVGIVLPCHANARVCGYTDYGSTISTGLWGIAELSQMPWRITHALSGRRGSHKIGNTKEQGQNNKNEILIRELTVPIRAKTILVSLDIIKYAQIADNA